MRDLIARSQVIEETAATKKGLVWILELLVFVAVFFVGTIAQMIVAVPVSIFAMLTDQAYVAAVAKGDPAAMLEAEVALNQRLMGSDWYMIFMLFSDLVLMCIVFLFCRFIQKRRLRTLGFVKRDILKEYGRGCLLGFLFFSVCVALALLTGGLEYGGVSEDFSPAIFLMYLLGYMVQGMAEEVLCRGYFLGSYARRYPLYAAVWANALLFAALHLLNSGITVLAFVNLTLFGIFASLYFIRRGSIWGIGAFHSIWNLVQGNFFGIKVSGTPLGNTFLTMTPTEGRWLRNGGDFGMEGSLLCTLVYVAGIVWLLAGKNRDGGEITQPIDDAMPPLEETASAVSAAQE